MRRRETLAGLFVLVMLGLGTAVILHWRAQQPVIASPEQNTLPAEWHRASPSEYAAAKATIGGQLAAFQSGDFRKATLYQASMLRRTFQTSESFRAVITGRYPQFCHFASVAYGRAIADPDGDMIRMEILLTGSDGRQTRADYFLHKENGMYRVGQVLTGDDAFRLMRHPYHPEFIAPPMRFGPQSGVHVLATRVGAEAGMVPPPPGFPVRPERQAR